jgi:hypothetical protein
MNEALPDVSEKEKELDQLRKKWPDENGQYPLDYDAIVDSLKVEIAKGHDYVFIGRVGQFCPVKSGAGGGLLVRESIDKKTGEKRYDAATGTKGYRWMESEMVKVLEKQDQVDRSYYDAMVDAAVHDISQYGDFEWFVSDDSNDIPPWEAPEEPHGKEATPFDVR